MPKIEEHTKNILETEKKRRIVFWILNKIMEVLLFLG